MQQGMTRPCQNDSDEAGGGLTSWKKPILIVGHTIVAITYGFAIIVMNINPGRLNTKRF